MINHTIFTKRLWEVFSQPVPPKRESDVLQQFLIRIFLELQ